MQAPVLIIMNRDCLRIIVSLSVALFLCGMFLFQGCAVFDNERWLMRYAQSLDDEASNQDSVFTLERPNFPSFPAYKIAIFRNGRGRIAGIRLGQNGYERADPTINFFVPSYRKPYRFDFDFSLDSLRFTDITKWADSVHFWDLDTGDSTDLPCGMVTLDGPGPAIISIRIHGKRKIIKHELYCPYNQDVIEKLNLFENKIDGLVGVDKYFH